MKPIIRLALPVLTVFAGALFISSAASARDNYLTSPTSPYPAGCVSNNNAGLVTPTQSRQTYVDDAIQLTDAAGGSDANVGLQIYRRGCIEPGRSILFVQLENFTINRLVAMPKVFMLVGETRYPLRLVGEPNTFDVDNTGLIYGLGTFEFVVDGVGESAVNVTTPILTPEQYNGAQTLILQDSLDASKEYSTVLPAWNTDIKPQRYPFNGRLSGVWVSEGASDQGFVLSINEFLETESARLQMFFSWYTFDQNGELLWLTANDFFDFNASTVELALQLVSDGEFLGSKVAARQDIGTVTLDALGCAEIAMDFDLTALGLGTDTITLTRAFALETAGYACRDVRARLDAK